jgi:hypothetical protein
MQIYPYGLGGYSGYYNGTDWGEDICQRVNYEYGSLSGTGYNQGRLSNVSYGYSASLEHLSLGTSTSGASVEIDYANDSAGRLMAATYPREGTTTPTTYGYMYDSMGRPLSMTDNDHLNYDGPYTGSGTTWAQNAQYDPAGRMTNMDTWVAHSSLSNEKPDVQRQRPDVANDVVGNGPDRQHPVQLFHHAK